MQIEVNRNLTTDVGLAEARKSTLAAFVGFFVDMFDIYLPMVALAPAMVYFTPQNLPAAVSATIFYLTFAATLLGRPIGSITFGHFGDKIGRKRTAIVSILGFGVATLLVSGLPGYEKVGLTSPILLIVLRFVGGIFLGGEYTAANPLAMEAAPKSKRGLWGAFISAGYTVGYVAISLITLLMLKLTPANGLHSPFVQWGWRIPFIVGFLMSPALAIYFWKAIPESKLWLKAEKASAPLKELFAGANLRTFFQAFVVMNGIWLCLEGSVGTFPSVLISILKVNAAKVTLTLMIVNAILFFVYLGTGILGQRIGRKTVLILVGILCCTVAPFLYYYLVASSAQNTFLLVLLVLIIESIVMPGGWAVGLPYLTERFGTKVRSSGFGAVFGLSVVIPSFYSFYMLGLKYLMPYKYTQLVLLVVGGILIIIGAALGPETKDLDLNTMTSV